MARHLDDGANIEQVNWPVCGEIDIMEFVGKDSSHVHGTIHYAKEDGLQHSSSGSNIEVLQPYNDFHVYALQWDKKELRIFFDDRLIHAFQTSKATTSKGNPFRKPFYLILNLALGGAWGGKVDESTLPQSFLIDYVRVYR